MLIQRLFLSFVMIVTSSASAAELCDVVVASANTKERSTKPNDNNNVRNFSLVLNSALTSSTPQTATILSYVRSLSKQVLNHAHSVLGQTGQVTAMVIERTAETFDPVRLESDLVQLRSGDFKSAWNPLSKKMSAAELQVRVKQQISILLSRRTQIEKRIPLLIDAISKLEEAFQSLSTEIHGLNTMSRVAGSKKSVKSESLNVAELLMGIQSHIELVSDSHAALGDRLNTLRSELLILKNEAKDLEQYLETKLPQLGNDLSVNSLGVGLTENKPVTKTTEVAVRETQVKVQSAALTPELLKQAFRRLVVGDKLLVVLVNDPWSKEIQHTNLEYTFFESGIGLIEKSYPAMVTESSANSFSKFGFWIEKNRFWSYSPALEFTHWKFSPNEYTLGRTGSNSRVFNIGAREFTDYNFKLVLQNPEMEIGQFKIGSRLQIKKDASESIVKMSLAEAKAKLPLSLLSLHFDYDLHKWEYGHHPRWWLKESPVTIEILGTGLSVRSIYDNNSKNWAVVLKVTYSNGVESLEHVLWPHFEQYFESADLE